MPRTKLNPLSLPAAKRIITEGTQHRRKEALKVASGHYWSVKDDCAFYAVSEEGRFNVYEYCHSPGQHCTYPRGECQTLYRLQRKLAWMWSLSRR